MCDFQTRALRSLPYIMYRWLSARSRSIWGVKTCSIGHYDVLLNKTVITLPTSIYYRCGQCMQKASRSRYITFKMGQYKKLTSKLTVARESRFQISSVVQLAVTNPIPKEKDTVFKRSHVKNERPSLRVQAVLFTTHLILTALKTYTSLSD